MNVTKVDYLIDHDLGLDATQYDRILQELPALISHQIPVYLLSGSALSLLIVDAGTTWGRAEKQLLGLYVRVTRQPILTVLNRVEPNYIDGPGRCQTGVQPYGAFVAGPAQRPVTGTANPQPSSSWAATSRRRCRTVGRRSGADSLLRRTGRQRARGAPGPGATCRRFRHPLQRW